MQCICILRISYNRSSIYSFILKTYIAPLQETAQMRQHPNYDWKNTWETCRTVTGGSLAKTAALVGGHSRWTGPQPKKHGAAWYIAYVHCRLPRWARWTMVSNCRSSPNYSNNNNILLLLIMPVPDDLYSVSGQFLAPEGLNLPRVKYYYYYYYYNFLISKSMGNEVPQRTNKWK